MTPPDAPFVTSSVLNINGYYITNDRTPTWNWSIPDGTVDIRFRLDGETWQEIGDTSVLSYTPASELPEGSHTLEVQAADKAGNWSDSASHNLAIDITPPAIPVVSGESLTGLATPTWTWSYVSDVSQYRFRLDSGEWTSASIYSRDFTPVSALDDGFHLIEVQSSDTVGNWSESGEYTTLVDSVLTFTPVVSGITPTNNARPAWDWSYHSEAVNCRYNLDSSGWVDLGGTDRTTFTPGVDLPEGSHTLEVQQESRYGNWSDIGSLQIYIDMTAPSPPQFTCASTTGYEYPIWTWKAFDGANFRYSSDEISWTIIPYSFSGGSCTSDTAISLGESATLFVQLQDNAGNWSDSISKTITRVEAYIDLEVYGSFISPSSLNWGDKTNISYRVINHGTIDSGDFSVSIYLSEDSTITTSDIFIGDEIHSTVRGGFINSSTIYNIVIPTEIVGNCYIGILIDSTNSVSESNENNNKASNNIGIISPSYPNLIPWQLYGDPAVAAGDDISIDVGARNAGGGMSAGPFVIKIYLSTNTIINSSDVLIGSYTIPGLSNGSATSSNVYCVIPASTSPGNYYVGYIVDGNSDVLEIDETDNVTDSPVSVVVY